jgi:hypothetical protein
MLAVSLIALASSRPNTELSCEAPSRLGFVSFNSLFASTEILTTGAGSGKSNT